MSGSDASLDPGPTLSRWVGSLGVLALGVGFAGVFALSGIASLALVTAAVAFAVAWWNSPARRGVHEPLADLASTRGDTVVVLWRPGCPISAELRRRLRRDGESVHWVNIWRDPAGAELCRSLNHGTEQVPTVCVLDSKRARPVVIPATSEGIRDAVSAPLARRSAA